MGRFAYVGAAVAASLAMAGCYSVPQPACGFFCGSGGECPADYTCSSADNRCHLNGSPPQMCATNDAGPVDSVPTDVPIDGKVGPAIVGVTPANDGTGVSVGTVVTATFTKEVFGANVATFSLRDGGTPVTSTVTYMTGTHVATLDPVEQLAANTTYTATLTTGIGDADGLPIPATTWTFTTGADTVGPNIASRMPAQGGTQVPVNATLSVRFDEPVTGVSPSTFTLQAGATVLTGTTTYTAATRTAVFTPDAQLPASTLLTATLTGGITDAATNPLFNAPQSWTFTTDVDSVAPQVQSSVPANGGTAISTGTTITVVFDEPVTNVTTATFTVNDGAAVTGTLTSALGGRSWTFTPGAALAAAATVTVTLTTAITDASANPLAAPVTFTFTTQ